LLSKAAIETNMSRVIAELGQVEARGTGRIDPLSDVPKVMPVKKLAVSPLFVVAFRLD
jgi:DNA-directed RNA polymerase, mitochondrial